MSAKADRICDLSPDAAIAWMRTFLSEARTIAEVRRFVAFCEADCVDGMSELSKRGVTADSAEYGRIDQVLRDLRNQASQRIHYLRNLEVVNRGTPDEET